MIHTMLTRRTCCRLCDGEDLKLVLHIKPSPIGDAFVPYDQKDKPQELFPLDLYQCQQCGHAQNIDIVNPDVLFRDYIFTTGSSAGLVEHFRKYAKEIVEKFSHTRDSLVVEIGSNDGTLLRFFKELGMKILGVDPAREIAMYATKAGIPTLPEFFSAKVAKQIFKEQGPIKLIVANNVYAHCDQLADITDGIALLLDQDGVFIFEVSYLLDIIDNFVFDTIYHEHLSYHSIFPLKLFFQRHQLEVFDVEKVMTKGGSLRCFVQRLGGPHKKSRIVDQMIYEELRRGLYSTCSQTNKYVGSSQCCQGLKNDEKKSISTVVPALFNQYEMQILQRKKQLTQFLVDALDRGNRVVGYGASTTVTTLMYHFELENKLSYLIDDNIKKHNMLSPGCHLQVLPSSVLYEDRPDIVIILAWQYAQPIMRKHERFVEENGIFIIPLPEFTMISNKNF